MRKDTIIVILVYLLAALILGFVGLLGVPFYYAGPKAIHPDTTFTDWLFWAGITVFAAGFIFVRLRRATILRYHVARVLIWYLRAWMFSMTVAFFIRAVTSSDHWNAVFFRGQGTGWILIAVSLEAGSLCVRRRYA